MTANMSWPSTISRIRSLFSKVSTPTYQVVSDLHLEVGQQYSSFELPPAAPYLILAGDIGRLIDYDSYLSFLTTQTSHFELVFLVLGNHEFYGLSISAGLEEARKFEREAVLSNKLILLHQTRFDVPNSETIILGCTLWSKIPDEAREIVLARVKDFEKILGWTVDDHNEAHQSDLTWLLHQHAAIQQENGSQAKGRRIMVVTHHAPSIQETSSPKNVGNPWSSAFATDLLGAGNWQGVKVWVFGHTHFTTEFEKCGIKFLSNQRGYVLPKSVGVDKSHDATFDLKRAIRV